MNITLAEIIPSLLPCPEILQLNSWELDKTATQIAVNVTSVQNPVRCPVCLAVSHRIHSQYRRNSTFQERNGRSDRGRSKLDPYKDYLLEQWNQRCYDTKKLFKDIQKRGCDFICK